jgi:ElaB/YqjD/DUF883 family membrane-anchored ribosome-binding protein
MHFILNQTKEIDMFTNSKAAANSESNHKSDGSKLGNAAEVVSAEFHSFVADIDDLINATKTLSGEELEKAKAKINSRIDAAKGSISSMSNNIAKQATKTAATTNAYVHDRPWPIIGATAAIGFFIGYMSNRRNS